MTLLDALVVLCTLSPRRLFSRLSPTPTWDDAKQVGSETMRTRSGLPRLEEMEALADEIDALEKAGDRESPANSWEFSLDSLHDCVR